MRYLFVSTSEALPWGGSEVLWIRIAEELLVQGHHVAFSYQHFAEEPAALASLRARGAKGYYRGDPGDHGFVDRICRVARRRKAQSDFPAFTEPHWLLSLVMEERPDLVILNACDAYMIWPLAGAFRQLKAHGIPYAIMCHLEDESYMFNPRKRDALTALYGGAVEVSFGARFGAELVSRQLGIPHPGVEIFDNPRNCSGEIQERTGDRLTARFACVGRLDVTAKGQDVMLAAFAGPQWKDRDWSLSFYGKGWEQPYLEKLTAMYGLEKNVTFAGFQKGIDSVWAQEDVCIQTSPKEGTPMTVVEAMSAGRPCLVTDIGRMPDLIEEGDNGWVCSRGVASVSAALERAWAQREEWPDMGRRGHEKISRVWNFEYPKEMAERVVQLAEKRRSRP